MSAGGTVKAWVDAYNASDVDALSALYADEASIEVNYIGRLDGKARIKAAHEESFARDAAHLAKMSIVRLHDAGDAAVVEWRDVKGLVGVNVFDVADGLITSQRVYFDRLTENQQSGQ